MDKTSYVVATIKPWQVEVFKRQVANLPGTWSLISSPDELTLEAVAGYAPRYIFFPHWSWKVPKEIHEKYECVVFHETDVPFGRGGSPIQNLIERGHTETMISALRMTDELDAGDVYFKRPLSLDGTANEIFARSAHVIAGMIEEIVSKEPTPAPQVGEPVVFTRRTPTQSRIPDCSREPQKFYDHVRMLDADGYPPAFLEHGGFRFEFSKPVLKSGEVHAAVCVTPVDDHD